MQQLSSIYCDLLSLDKFFPHKKVGDSQFTYRLIPIMRFLEWNYGIYALWTQ